MGILEQLLAAIQANTAAHANGGTANGGAAPAHQPAYVPPQSAQPLQPSSITAEQITALIQPHIGNEQIKTALGNAMRANGVANLPEAQPHQYGALYQAFQNVLAQFGIGGAQAQQPGVGASII